MVRMELLMPKPALFQAIRSLPPRRGAERSFHRTPWIGVLGLATVTCCGQVTTTQNSSVYTDLSGPSCTITTENRETGATVHRCKGVSGWDLLVLYDDQRMSITVVQPDGRTHPLDYWDVITQGYSSLGAKAEWRVDGAGMGRAEPIALIVRVNASEQQTDGTTKTVSYLAVAKLQGPRVCVTDKIRPTLDSNARARQAADNAAGTPCLR